METVSKEVAVKSWYRGFGAGLVCVLISLLVIWAVASSDTSFEQSWLVGTSLFPLAGVYFGWYRNVRASVREPAEWRNARLVYIAQGTFFAGVTQYLSLVVTSAVWEVGIVERVGEQVHEASWGGLVFAAAVAGAFFSFWLTRGRQPAKPS